LEAFLKNPEQMAFCALATFLPQDTISSLCLESESVSDFGVNLDLYILYENLYYT